VIIPHKEGLAEDAPTFWLTAHPNGNDNNTLSMMALSSTSIGRLLGLDNLFSFGKTVKSRDNAPVVGGVVLLS
jgi:hypothetical protein